MKRKWPVLTLIPLLLLIAACNSQTNYQLWTTAGTLVDSWLKVYDPTFDRTTLDTSWAAAGQDILNWKAGTACQNVEQAINDSLAIVATIPVTDPKQALILATAVVGAETVEAFFLKCAPVTTTAAQYSPALQKAVEAQRKTPATDAKMLKKQWKAAGGQ